MIEITKEKIREAMLGDKNHRWKGGITNNIKEYMNKYRNKNKQILNESKKEWRHKNRISKEYREEYNGRSKTIEYKRLHRKIYKYNLKQAGELSIKIIQRIYEDNIKQYGTLTCYLCLKPIEFGQDSLEHKIPLSRRGTNARDNLDVACQKCNCKKHTKTNIEYKKEVL